MKTGFRKTWLVGAFVVGLLIAWVPGLLWSSQSSSDLDRFVASLAGGWAGENNATPMGPMPFAALFEWEEDGSLHAHSAMNRETYIDLRFQKDEEGRWILTEEAVMEGLGTQSYSLVPVDTKSDRDGLRRWVYPEDPEFLVIDLGVEEDTLSMNVLLRGEEHTRFALARLPDEALPELARQMKLQAEQSPEEGVSIHDMMTQRQQSAGHEERAGSSETAETSETAVLIQRAREALAGNPDDAGAHLALARALGATIRENQVTNGPLYAFEMLDTLHRTIELDPHRAEAYHWLVGYYLNAPVFAGGSLDKAEGLARRLAEFDPEGGETLLAQVEERRPSGE